MAGAPPTGAAYGGLPSLGVGIAGMLGAFGPDQYTLPTANATTRQYLGMLSGLASGAPIMYGLESQYQPKYTALELQNLNTALMGTQATPGLLSMYTQGIMPALTQAQIAATTAQRGANLANLAGMGPGAVQAYQAANPTQAALIGQLQNQAQQGLAAGTGLTPQQLRYAQQMTRMGQAARGLGWGPSDVFQETLAGTQLGNQLLQQRQAFAQGIAPLGETQTANALNILGGQSAVPGAAQTFLGGSRIGGGPQLITPAMSSDLFGTSFNALAGQNWANTNAANAFQASMLGDIASY
jgi:hypothetical protein